MEENRQAEMERRICAFIDKINGENADTMCGLIKPRFISCDSETNTLTMAYPVQRWESNPIGRMQGGVIATILDFSVACLAVYLGGGKPVTVSMQVSYLRPGPISGSMLVKVSCTKAGRTLIHAFAECWDEDAPDKTVATANMVYTA